MKVFILITIVATTLAFKVSYEGYKVYRVDPVGKTQLDALAALRNHPRIDFWSPILRNGGKVDVMVHPDDLNNFVQHLQRYSIKYQVRIDNVARLVEEEEKLQKAAPRADDGEITFIQYHRHSEINKYLDRLAVDYPLKVKIETIGQSYEDRDLKVIKISKNVSDENPRPIIFIDAGIHAREWIAPPVALYTIQELVENRKNSHMLDECDWHVLPVLNPDGYEYSHTSERFWRKTRTPSANTQCSGTDGNRNFDFHWSEIGSSDDPCAEDYHGSKAFSESETAAIRNYVNRNKHNIKLYLTFHSYGPLILFPWGYTEELPENSPELQSLGERVAEAIGKIDGTSYIVGSSTNVLYAAAGGSDDWVKGVGGVALSYTIELPPGGWMGFNPPPTKILPVVKETWEGIKVYHQHIVGSPRPDNNSDEGDSASIPSSKIVFVFLGTITMILLELLLQ